MMQVNLQNEPRLSLSDCLTRGSASGMITLYQRYISPHKGFRCAHRGHHGGPSCSAYAKTAVQTHGSGAALPLIRERFTDCGQVARMMRSQLESHDSNAERSPNEEERKQSNGWIDSSWDGLNPCIPDSVFDCTLLDSCNIWPDGPRDCDGCGDVGLSGCDGCDVGGCDF